MTKWGLSDLGIPGGDRPEVTKHSGLKGFCRWMKEEGEGRGRREEGGAGGRRGRREGSATALTNQIKQKNVAALGRARTAHRMTNRNPRSQQALRGVEAAPGDTRECLEVFSLV